MPNHFPGDTVRVRSQKGTWEPAKVVESVTYKSHKIVTPQGKVYRRNRRDNLKTKEDRSIFQKYFFRCH